MEGGASAMLVLCNAGGGPGASEGEEEEEEEEEEEGPSWQCGVLLREVMEEVEGLTSSVAGLQLAVDERETALEGIRSQACVLHFVLLLDHRRTERLPDSSPHQLTPTLSLTPGTAGTCIQLSLTLVPPMVLTAFGVWVSLTLLR